MHAHVCSSGRTVNDEDAEGQRTCSQALLDLFQVLLQALPLPIQLCVFLLQVLNSAVSAIVWATATLWTASQHPRDTWGLNRHHDLSPRNHSYGPTTQFWPLFYLIKDCSVGCSASQSSRAEQSTELSLVK